MLIGHVKLFYLAVLSTPPTVSHIWRNHKNDNRISPLQDPCFRISIHRISNRGALVKTRQRTAAGSERPTGHRNPYSVLWGAHKAPPPARCPPPPLPPTELSHPLTPPPPSPPHVSQAVPSFEILIVRINQQIQRLVPQCHFSLSVSLFLFLSPSSHLNHSFFPSSLMSFPYIPSLSLSPSHGGCSHSHSYTKGERYQRACAFSSPSPYPGPRPGPLGRQRWIESIARREWDGWRRAWRVAGECAGVQTFWNGGPKENIEGTARKRIWRRPMYESLYAPSLFSRRLLVLSSPSHWPCFSQGACARTRARLQACVCRSMCVGVCVRMCSSVCLSSLAAIVLLSTIGACQPAYMCLTAPFLPLRPNTLTLLSLRSNAADDTLTN